MEVVAAEQRLALAVVCAGAGLPDAVAGRLATEQRSMAVASLAEVGARAAAERNSLRGAALRSLRRRPGIGVLLAHGPELGLSVGASGCDDSVSRSLTIWFALWRLGLLPQRHETGAVRPVRVAVLGAQAAKEGNTPAGTAAVFEVLRQLLHLSGVVALDLLLCGPEVGTATAPLVAVELAEAQQRRVERAGDTEAPRVASDASKCCCCALRVEYLQGLYHEVQSSPPTADLIVCFQPGIWGYASWQPTIRSVLRGGAPCVITSYSWAEADDDCGTLEEWGLPSEAWVRHGWEVEPNPYAAAGSRVVEQPRLTASGTAGGGPLEQDGEMGELGPRTLHDNHHWQCVRWAGSWVSPMQSASEDETWQPEGEGEAQTGGKEVEQDGEGGPEQLAA